MTELIPPDLLQCQAEVHTYQPFVMGGKVNRWERCSNKPTMIAEEVVTADGGPMTLCADCANACRKQLGDKVRILPLWDF